MSLAPVTGGPVPRWMQAWEERQKRQLEQHEEATREFLQDVRRELLSRLDEMEKSHQEARCKKAANFQKARMGAAAASEEKERLLEASPAGGSNHGSNHVTFTASGRPTSDSAGLVPKQTCANLNQAMINAIGCAKAGTGSRISLNEGTSSYSMHHTQTKVYEPRNHFQARLFHLVHNHWFELCSGGIILLYTIAVGVMSDMDMRAAIDREESPQWRYFVDLGFTCVFFVEVVLRMMAEGLHYISRSNKDRSWNVFDFTVACVGLLDIFAVFQISLSFLRVMRTLRAIRVLRVIRIFRFFKELRLMVASIMCCLWSLTWAFLLLISVMYIFAVVLLQGASDYLHSSVETQVPTSVRNQLFDDFGDIVKTVYSLTQAVSGGRSWGEYAAPFIVISPWYGVFFTLFVVFVIFGVLNILTGVFVESTSAVASFDKELVIQEEMTRNESAVSQIRALFREIDHDNSGTLTFKELKRNLSDERVKAYFSVLQMDVSEAAGLFELLDRDESGEVSIEEFIMTCMKLKGTARSIDLATMLFESKRLYSTIKKFMHNVDEAINDVKTKLWDLQHMHEMALC